MKHDSPRHFSVLFTQRRGAAIMFQDSVNCVNHPLSTPRKCISLRKIPPYRLREGSGVGLSQEDRPCAR